MSLRPARFLMVAALGAMGFAVPAAAQVQSTESTGLIFRTGASSPGTERMRITQNGYVGIGTVNPQMPLDVSATSAYAIRGITSAANYAIMGQSTNASYGGVLGYTANGTHYGILGYSNAYSFYGNGQVYSGSNNSNAAIYGANSAGGHAVQGNGVNAYGGYFTSSASHGAYGQTGAYGGVGVMGYNGNTGAYAYLGYQHFGVYCGATSGGGCGGNDVWTNHSDARLKEQVEPLDDSMGLAAVMKLRPVTFHWKDAKRDDSSGEQLGFIAQEVEQVLPGVVHSTPTSETVVGHDGRKTKVENVKSMSYATVVVPLVKAVQELKHENDTLRADLEALRAEVRALKQ